MTELLKEWQEYVEMLKKDKPAKMGRLLDLQAIHALALNREDRLVV